MHLPRRRFLKTSMLSAVSAGLALAAGRAVLAQTTSTSGTQTPQRRVDFPIEIQKEAVFSFSAATFEPYVGSIFTAPNARGEQVQLKLLKLKTVEATNALKYTKRAVATDGFTLVFQADSELPPFTSIHKINHPALGEFYLFLSPRKGESGELFYEAVINHIP